MKKSIILIFLTAWSFAQGRNTNTFEDPLYHPTPVRSSKKVNLEVSDTVCNFFQNKGDVTWRYVFNTPLDATEISDKLLRSGLLDVEFSDSTRIVGTKKREVLNLSAYGVSAWSQKLYTTYPMDCYVIIDIKDNRYRVTLSKFNFYPTRDLGSAVAVYGVAVTSKTNSNYSDGLNTYYNYKKSKFQDTFKKYDAPVFDDAFRNIFDIDTYVPKSNDQW